jgi:hypothetical protein
MILLPFGVAVFQKRSTMGNLLNAIIALLILVIVSAVCSTYFYKKGQESGWGLSKQLVPLKKGGVYLAVEKTDNQGVSFITIQEISEATKDKSIDQRELRFRLKLALDGVSLEEYNNKYRNDKKGM